MNHRERMAEQLGYVLGLRAVLENVLLPPMVEFAIREMHMRAVEKLASMERE